MTPVTLREHARSIWQAGVDAVAPARSIEAAADLLPSGPVSVIVVGGGKAGAAMSAALESVLERRGVDLARVRGVVTVPDETVVPLRAIRLHASRPTGVNEPTEASVEGTRAMLRLLDSATDEDVAIALVSGGGSALVCAPAGDVTLADKREVAARLQAAGADISEINAVRKHLSEVKGGGFVRRFRGRRMLGLVVSDVVGDPLDVIASGPTAADPTTYADALAVLARHKLVEQVPARVRAHLERGAAGLLPETLKALPADASGAPVVENAVIANVDRAIAAARAHAEALGYAVTLVPDVREGDTNDVAEKLARATRAAASRTCLLSGGETTVTLPDGHGLGGRNQQLVLACTRALGPGGLRGVVVLSAGTDGEDGPTDAAGALADVGVLEAALRHGLSVRDHLARHDAYHFFAPLGALVKTGLTGTNVMDLRVVLVDRS